MDLFRLYLKFSNNRNINFFVYLVFITFFIISTQIFKDYGFSIDEPFHRASGYYWYLWILDQISTNVDKIQAITEKFKEIAWSSAFASGEFLDYGATFDLFAVFIEENFNLSETNQAYYLKRSLAFSLFFISIIFFYLIILSRFKNRIFSITILIFYLTYPRIFAHSFYNVQDLVFMSLCVISIYFCLKSFDNFSFKNIILLSIFTALATQERIVGILLYVLFIVFYLTQSLEEKKFFKKNLVGLSLFILSYPIFVYIFGPYLWGSPAAGILNSLKTFSGFGWNNYVFYLGDYIKATDLPWHYIPVWIFVTTPIFYLIFFISGLIKITYDFIKNILSLDEGPDKKIWLSINQKKDFFIFSFFITPIFLVILLNSTLYTGWRHLYFVYPALIYILALGINFVLNIKIKKLYKNFIIYFIIISIFVNLSNLIKLHPYQNVYFNFLVEKKANKLFEIDYWGLGNLEAIKFILDKEKKESSIRIRTASFTPLSYSKNLLSKNEIKKIKFEGTANFNQKYIFTNYIYDKNPKYEKKYKISNNYKKIYTLRRGNIIVNEIFQKN